MPGDSLLDNKFKYLPPPSALLKMYPSIILFDNKTAFFHWLYTDFLMSNTILKTSTFNRGYGWVSGAIGCCKHPTESPCCQNPSFQSRMFTAPPGCQLWKSACDESPNDQLVYPVLTLMCERPAVTDFLPVV